MELRTPAAFTRSAWFYDKLATLIYQNAIHQSQVALLRFIPANARILIIGGGTGYILRDMARLHVPLQIIYLEASPTMLAQAKRVAQQLSSNFLKIYFRPGTETTLSNQENFDVIFTPFVLDLYATEQATGMIKHLLRHLNTNGLWLLADFFISPGLKGWSRWWRLGLTRIMYVFFSWLEGLTTRQLPDLHAIFKNLPLQQLTSQPFFHGFIQGRVYRKTSGLPD